MCSQYLPSQPVSISHLHWIAGAWAVVHVHRATIQLFSSMDVEQIYLQHNSIHDLFPIAMQVRGLLLCNVMLHGHLDAKHNRYGHKSNKSIAVRYFHIPCIRKFQPIQLFVHNSTLDTLNCPNWSSNLHGMHDYTELLVYHRYFCPFVSNTRGMWTISCGLLAVDHLHPIQHSIPKPHDTLNLAPVDCMVSIHTHWRFYKNRQPIRLNGI